MFDDFSSESLMFFMCNCNLDRVAVWIELKSGSLHFILGTVNSADVNQLLNYSKFLSEIYFM